MANFFPFQAVAIQTTCGNVDSNVFLGTRNLWQQEPLVPSFRCCSLLHFFFSLAFCLFLSNHLFRRACIIFKLALMKRYCMPVWRAKLAAGCIRCSRCAPSDKGIPNIYATLISLSTSLYNIISFRRHPTTCLQLECNS